MKTQNEAVDILKNVSKFCVGTRLVFYVNSKNQSQLNLNSLTVPYSLEKNEILDFHSLS